MPLAVRITSLNVCNHPITEATRVVESLLQLDNLGNPGITSEQFTSLFVQCICSMVITKHAFVFHTCLSSQIIDLTLELEGDDIVIDLTQDRDDSRS